MITTTEKPAKPDPARLDRAVKLAATLLAGRRLGKKLPVAAGAIGRALAATEPKSEHGRLLFRALSGGTGDRREDEQAVIHLACKGITPTAAAVAGRLAQLAAQAQALATDAAGLEAASYTDEVLRETGTGLLWREVADHLGVPRQPYPLAGAVIEKLARAGWLAKGT